MRLDVVGGDEVLAVSAQLRAATPASILAAVGAVPVRVIEDEPFPSSLRLILSSHCEQRCQYPDEGELWCHNEGVPRDGVKAPTIEPLLEIAAHFRDRYGYRSVKIGGLEPVLGPRVHRLLGGLRLLGYDDVSFTTHGRGVNGQLSALRDAGLGRVTVSIHSLDRENYRKLTGRDGLPDALSLVREATALSLTPLKINRVLLRGYTDDLPALVDWAQADRISVRLFDLMWQPGHDRHYGKYFVPWLDFLPLWRDRTAGLVVRRYSTSLRTRITFELAGGGAIEVNLLQPKRDAGASVCHTCQFDRVCAEGYLGCGVRITPDLKFSPCILRNDLGCSVADLPRGGAPPELAEIIRGTLAGANTIRASPPSAGVQKAEPALETSWRQPTTTIEVREMGKPYDGTGGWRIAAPIGAWEPPLAEYVAKYVADDRTGHDFYHCLRVRALAVRIADGEALDPEVMVAAAYLHDIGRDQERSGAGDHVAIGEAEAAKILPTLGFPASKLAAVAQCIHYHEEYDWVRDGRARECSGVREIAGFQDADRLDAIGAIGLARMFMFGGAYDRPLWIPNVAPGTWRHGELGAATYNHLYEKLLKLKEKMNTTTGRRLAESRHRFMKSYARRFEREWEGLL